MDKIYKRAKKEFFIKDPIHNYITVKYKIIEDLIQTRELQRLRNILQLGIAQYIYPSATHTRFSHSLGTYEVSRQIADKTYFKNRGYEKILLLCVSLLHDIGHGPISHSFEQTIDNFDHELMGVKILTEKSSEVSIVLNSYDERLIPDICDLLCKKSKYNAIQQLISSDIDVDRMDYLLRDSHQTSSSLGNYDLGRIIYGMQINETGIHFNLNSLNVLEDFLLSRVHMYNQVYIHKRSIIIDKIMTLYLKKKLSTKYDENCNLYKFNVNRDIESFNKLTDHKIFDLLINEEDENLKILSNAIINRDKSNIKKVDSSNKTFDDSNYVLLYDPEIEQIKKIYNGGINIRINNENIDLNEVSLIINKLNNSILKIQGEHKFYAKIKN